MITFYYSFRYHRMMISKVKPLHQKVEETTSAVDDAEHKMSTLENKRKALEVRLAELAKGFEEATIDKNEQEDKTIKMKKMLETAAQLRKVGLWSCFKGSVSTYFSAVLILNQLVRLLCKKKVVVQCISYF